MAKPPFPWIGSKEEDRTVHPAAFPAQADAVCGTVRRQRRSAAGAAAGPKPIGHL